MVDFTKAIDKAIEEDNSFDYEDEEQKLLDFYASELDDDAFPNLSLLKSLSQ